jgi:hypothetical protein
MNNICSKEDEMKNINFSWNPLVFVKKLTE